MENNGEYNELDTAVGRRDDCIFPYSTSLRPLRRRHSDDHKFVSASKLTNLTYESKHYSYDQPNLSNRSRGYQPHANNTI